MGEVSIRYTVPPQPEVPQIREPLKINETGPRHAGVPQIERLKPC